MIRIRSKKLLSGVSTLAVMAAFGTMIEPALAGQTITAAGNPNAPVVNAAPTSDDFIDIQAGSFVLADGSGVSLFNSGTLTSFVNITTATLAGGVSNTGTILGSGLNISGSNIGGAIVNTGTINGNFPDGIFLNNSILNGGIQNNGATALIQGVTDGIVLAGNTVLLGGISNQGSIVGLGTDFADAIDIQGAGVVVNGGITNASGAVIQALVGSSGRAINLGTVAAFIGNIDNSGQILSSGSVVSQGINMSGGVFVGSIINRQSGSISATSGTGVNLSAGTLTGDIDNSGVITGTDRGVQSGATIAGQIINRTGATISGTGAGGVGVNITGGTLAQGITNDGDILANGSTGIAIQISGGTVAGGITNSGQVSATGSGGSAIVISGGTFTGGITNAATGLIQADDTAIVISVTNFTGDITNSGDILADDDDGMQISSTTFVGNVTNNADAQISAGSDAISWTAGSFTGDITNDGDLVAGATGIYLVGTTFTGNVTNNGAIDSTADGIVINTTFSGGDLTNAGAITSGGDGIDVMGSFDGNITNTADGVIVSNSTGFYLNGATITGDVTNDGKITASNVGIYLSGTIEGALTNTGAIDPSVGIQIVGQVDGGIFNSGDITATVTGVDISAGTAAHTITQTAGSIVGPVALNMVNGQVDTFSAQGGFVEGDIQGDGDIFDLNTATQFAYVSGAATGIDDFDVLASGTYLLGTDSLGVDGAGVQVTADHMRNLNPGDTSRVYLDDNTTITLTNDFDQASNGATAGTLEYFLTTNTGTHGVISAATANVDGTIAANLDPATFAAAPIATGVTFTYTGVITSGGLTGTFDNVGNVLVTSNPFFTGSVVYNGNDVDLLISRLAFNDVLVAASHNQQAVGTALEAIYTAGGYSSDLQDAFEALFSGGTTAEIQARLIELSGSQHAQVGQGLLSVTGSVNSMVRERLDQVLLSEDGVRWAGTPGQLYAQATAIASDAGSSAAGLRGSQGMTRGASGWSVWGRAFENEINVDTDPDASGYDHDSQGGIVGVDYATSPNTTLGASVTYATSDMWFDTAPDTADIESWQVNLFGSYGFGRFYLDGQGSYGFHDIGTLRSIDLPAPAGSDLASAAYDATTWSVNGELGAIWRLGRVNMQPSVSVSYVDVSADGFTESSTTGYALIVSGADGESLSSTLALRASGQWMMAKTPVVPDFKIGWRHEYLDDGAGFSASFIDDPSVAMSIVSSQAKPDSLVISSGATFGVTRNFEVFFDINGQYNADASLTNASGGVRVTW